MADNCALDILPDLIVATGIALVVFPGGLLSLPPDGFMDENRSKELEQNRVGLAGRIFFTQRVTLWNYLVHGVVFAILFLLFKLIYAFAGKQTCP